MSIESFLVPKGVPAPGEPDGVTLGNEVAAGNFIVDELIQTSVIDTACSECSVGGHMSRKGGYEVSSPKRGTRLFCTKEHYYGYVMDMEGTAARAAQAAKEDRKRVAAKKKSAAAAALVAAAVDVVDVVDVVTPMS